MIEINLKIDDDKLKTIIQSEYLNDNQSFFNSLLELAKAKEEVSKALVTITEIETVAKDMIDVKATASYGNEWQAIKGDGYKISKSFTGSKFKINSRELPADNYLKITKSIDSKAVDEYMELNDGKLPKGVLLNENRNSSIRITLK